MQCDEKKQICLNYAANVPEWQLDMALQAVADIGATISALGKVQKAVAGDMAWLRAHPGEDYLGTIPIDRVKACNDAARALGSALYALEVILTQSDQFGFAKGLAFTTEAAYNTSHAALKDRCRMHGWSEVTHHHGES